MILGSQPQTSSKKQLSDMFLFCVWIHAHTAWCMRRWAQTTASSELSRNHSSQEATSPPNHPVPFHVMLNQIILAKNDPLNGAVKTKWSRWDFNLKSPVNLWGTGLESGLSGGWCVGVKTQPWGKDFCRNYCKQLIGLAPTAISNPQQGKLPNCLLKRFCGFSALFFSSLWLLCISPGCLSCLFCSLYP